MNYNTPLDFGPIYTETRLNQFRDGLLFEPWNTASNLVFLIIVIYFAMKTQMNAKKHPLIVVGIPILFVGFIGGSLYHATRQSNVWLIMDFVPIFILAIVASLHFWSIFFNSFAKAIFIGLGIFLLSQMVKIVIEGIMDAYVKVGGGISVGYSFLAILLLLPAFLVCWRHKWENVFLLVYSTLFVGFAIYFRSLDGAVIFSILPMGTHFLWHIFGGLAVFCMMEYVYRLDVGKSEPAS